MALRSQGHQESRRVDRRTFRARDLGFEYDAPTEDCADEVKELYTKEYGSGAQELYRREGTPLSAWRDEEDPKLRQLMQAKERPRARLLRPLPH